MHLWIVFTLSLTYLQGWDIVQWWDTWGAYIRAKIPSPVPSVQKNKTCPESKHFSAPPLQKPGPCHHRPNSTVNTAYQLVSLTLLTVCYQHSNQNSPLKTQSRQHHQSAQHALVAFRLGTKAFHRSHRSTPPAPQPLLPRLHPTHPSSCFSNRLVTWGHCLDVFLIVLSLSPQIYFSILISFSVHHTTLGSSLPTPVL